ncbi:Short-chain dehydrogenase/reductase [Coniochaeta hoffmannii]|uniref:Short-chain dehydrogenase/reductase n=1 Tax=Coniochaeta hoffmannii TaxID=91930 RepID=A0AA38R298_9PEZI|nr:Short-chain dehydrogenase/reductase [Coniochaeta hoffmannii]
MPSKTVLITGCSEGGIGDALAREFRARGVTVFATARSVSKMSTLEPLGVHTLELDVTSEPSIAAAVEAVRAATDGHLDILINNAGVNHVQPFLDTGLADMRRVFDTNVIGVLAVTQALAPLLIASRGVVATIGSVNAVFNPPYQVAYNASKAAVLAVGDSLRVELAPFGVRVVTVVTGSVRSKLFDNADAACRVPPDSLYYPLKDRIEKRDFLDNARWTDTEAYARQVVSDLLKEKPSPVLWRASFSFVARLLDTIAWPGMLDKTYLKHTGLATLKAPNKA